MHGNYCMLKDPLHMFTKKIFIFLEYFQKRAKFVHMGIHTLKLNISKLYGDLWYIMTTWVPYNVFCRFSWAVYIYRRWINGPEVAKWGWCTWLTRIVHQLWEWVGIKRLFLQVYYIHGQYLRHWCHKWRFQKIWAISNQLWILEALVKLQLTRVC